MRSKITGALAGGLVAILALGVLSAGGDPPRGQQKATADDKAREADAEAIRKASAEFSRAFGKGDAKAVAAFWVAQGEYHHGTGVSLRGRDDIEKAFAEYFKAKPNGKVEVLIDSIRFPTADLAIEEGLLRMNGPGKELPTTSVYSVVHVREKDQWKIAVSREWGAGQDRLEDLQWLVGKWKATVKDDEVTLSFTRDEKKPVLLGQFTKKARGKVISSGTMRVGLDPQRGQLRSWHFDDDGGHGQALWLRDGNRWVLDSIGVLGDGTDTAAVDLLARLSNDEFTWRSIDRMAGDKGLPDTVPVKLTRVPEGK